MKKNYVVTLSKIVFFFKQKSFAGIERNLMTRQRYLVLLSAISSFSNKLQEIFTQTVFLSLTPEFSSKKDTNRFSFPWFEHVHTSGKLVLQIHVGQPIFR